MGRGACAGADTDRFFTPGEWFPGQRWSGPDQATKRLCSGCPVREECLGWALDQDEEHGYWGGTTANERDRLRRGIARKGCPICHSRSLFAQDGRQVCLDCGMSWRLKVAKAIAGHALANADVAA